MPTIRQIRRRIASVKSTAKITNAMQLVAASKMRRAQDRALQAQPYAQKLLLVLSGLAAGRAGADEESLHPLLVQRPVRTVGLLHITPDRGLCGGLNANLNRNAALFMAQQAEPLRTVAVGRKGRDFLLRARSRVVAEFSDLGDYPRQEATLGIARVIMEDYISGQVDSVYLSFPRFVSTAVQRPVIRQLLPLEPPVMEGEEAEKFRGDYIFEPSPVVVLERLLPRYLEMQIYEAILQTSASFQSAQMVAMKNATDNAHDIERELTLTYNKVRQEQITRELLDIVGGASALEG